MSDEFYGFDSVDFADENMLPDQDEAEATGRCDVCGAELEYAQCDTCGGEGGEHDCGEDTCCCDDTSSGDDDFVVCDDCDGDGGYWQCPNVPHTNEQIAAYHARVRAARIKLYDGEAG